MDKSGHSSRSLRFAKVDRVAVEQQANLEWQSNPAIRAEFVCKENFVAFKVAEAAGSIKVVGGLMK